MEFEEAWELIYPTIQDEGVERIAQVFFVLGKAAAMEHAVGIQEEALSEAIKEFLGGQHGTAQS